MSGQRAACYRFLPRPCRYSRERSRAYVPRPVHDVIAKPSPDIHAEQQIMLHAPRRGSGRTSLCPSFTRKASQTNGSVVHRFYISVEFVAGLFAMRMESSVPVMHTTRRRCLRFASPHNNGACLCQGMSRGEVIRSVAAACVAGSTAWSTAAVGVSAKAPAPVMKLPDGEKRAFSFG